MPSRLLALLLSGTALLATAVPAAAITPDAAAQALAKGLTGGTRATVTFEGTSEENGNIVVTGLTLNEAEGDDTFRFERTVIQAPTEDGDGIFKSPRIEFSNGVLAGEAQGSLESAALSDVTVLDPATVKSDAPASGVLFATAEASNFRATGEPGEFLVGRFTMAMSNFVDNVPQDSKGTVEAITIPPGAFKDSQVKPETFGYQNLVLNISWDGSRNQAAKTATVRDLTIGIQDGGDLSFSGIMGNLPEPSALNDSDASSKAGDVELHTMTMRFDDNSLTGRVLDYFATQQGVARQEFADGMAATAGLLLAALNNPEFQSEVSGALSTFLKDPESLTIKLEPEAPIAASEIAAIAGNAPNTLPDRLKASISANTTE